MLHCLIFEDDHLLVVNKPAGMNTHAPNPYSGEGVYDWLRHREPRWARLAIIHRLDKETSGVIVFAKTILANRSLTAQFTGRAVRKRYLLLTDHPMKRQELTVKSALIRAGEKYVARPAHAGTETAETRFRVLNSKAGMTLVAAEPVTGRTHQIRVHAASCGFPVLGDSLYGGTRAPRVHLHAQELTLSHPLTGTPATFAAPADFSADPRLALRGALIDLTETNAHRLVHGASDGWPGWYVDRLGDVLLSQSAAELNREQRGRLGDLLNTYSLRGAYHKILSRHVRHTKLDQASPQPVLGAEAPDEFQVLENGVVFGLSVREGYSVGLFLDQRDNRRRFLTGHIAAHFPWSDNSGQGSGLPWIEQDSRNAGPPLEILNTFAYTCGFSVCAAKAGAGTTNIDLSRKYLQWGQRNFQRNGLNPASHEFLQGDVFEWLRRFARKQRRFDLIVLDPPTFSQSKEQGAFQAGKDFLRLVGAALPVLKPGGILFASTNAAKLSPEDFLVQVTRAIQSDRRRIVDQHYAPQPPDFPVSAAEPAHLKTFWMRIAP